MKPKFLICRPDTWIEKYPDKHVDIVEFYNNLIYLLDEMNYEYTIQNLVKKIPTHDADTICLAHHSHLDEVQPNVWTAMKGYLPGYLNFDRLGWSGWSELAKNEELFKESQLIDNDVARKFFDDFTSKYKDDNVSKWNQKSKTEPMDLDRPFVFLACQKPGDEVMKLARVEFVEFIDSVVDAFKKTGYYVVIKPHPSNAKFDRARYKKMSHVILTDRSIHDILPNAICTIVINSGVGFESLLYLKQVFNLGYVDYHWVTNSLNKEDIKDIPNMALNPVDEDRIIKFIYYMLHKNSVNAYDKKSIKEKIDLMIDDFHRNRE